MFPSRITEEENFRNFRSPLWRSVFVLVGLLTLTSLTLDFVWLLYLSYISQIIKKVIWCWCCFNII